MCDTLVWQADGSVGQCGWMHRCAECERKYAILRAHLKASEARRQFAKGVGK